MASLNTLRTKGGVILSVVIAVALLAFLLGDLTSSGSSLLNSRKMRVGEINDNSIGYTEFYNLSEYMTGISQLMYGKSALSTEETDAVRNMAWDELISKYAYRPGFGKMGIMASQAEQVDMVSGEYISPVISSMFINPNTGAFDRTLLQAFIVNMDNDASGNSAALWNFFKNQMVSQREMSKFFALVNAGMFVNNLEVENGVRAANNAYNIDYVFDSYASTPDSLVKVSGAEIKKFYAEHEKMFRQNGGRGIEYVVFDLLPSEQDYADAAEYIEGLAAEFAESATPMQFATLNSQSTPSPRYYRESELEPRIAALAFGKDKGGMMGPELSGDTYTMARVADVKSLPDSIGARHILLPAAEKALADSLLTVLRNGGDFAAVADEYSLDTATPGGDLGVFAPELMLAEFADACASAKVGDLFTVNTQYGLHIVKLDYKSAASPVAQIASISYKVEPSSYTQQTVYGEASKFLSAAAGSVEKFREAVTQEGLSKRVATIANTDRNVSGLNDSRELVRWAFNGKQGEVSAILEVGGDYVVAALTEVREPGVASIEQTASDIRQVLRFEKKGDMIAEKMQGSTLEQIASAVGGEVKSADSLQFNTFYIDGIGMEPKLLGAVSGAKPGAVSKPVKGSMGVYVFTVTADNQADNATFESEKVRLEAMNEYYLSQRLVQALVEQSKVVDMRVKFF